MKYFKIISISCFLFFTVSLLFNPMSSSKASVLDDLKQQIADKETEIKQLEEQAKAYQQSLNETQQQKNTLQNQLNIIQGRINKLRTDISVTTAKISTANLQIERLGLEISDKTQQIGEHKENIAGMIRALYEYDEKTLLELVLVNNKFSDFLSQVEYIEMLQKNVQKDLEALKVLKSELENQKQQVELQKVDLENYKAQLSSQNQIEQNQKSQKDSLLKQTRGQEQKYQQMLADVEAKQRQIQEEIFELEDKLRLTLDPTSIPAFHSGVLSWPNEGLLTQYYGYTPYSKKLYKSGFHNGIDIAAGYGAPIRAAADGMIKYLSNTDTHCPGGAYGRWIAIEHNNNLTTFYAHLSAFGKYKVGDTVKEGEIIGYEGSSGYSTGSHLHFGVYAANTFILKPSIYCGLLPIGATIDPMSYL
jgi:murein DD-endopeptidase MepM/ murein hydrolase activator NlpD